MTKKRSARYRKNVIPLKNYEINVYATPRISKALDEVVEDMTIYKGVRLSQIFEAVYIQGKKDGARETFEKIDKHVIQVKKETPHKLPGRQKG
jgi:hypothetical protein